MKRKKSAVVFLLICLFISWSGVADSQENKKPRYTDPTTADSDFKLQGEYEGMVGPGEDKSMFGIQVIALGDGEFSAVGFPGGLPGNGWDGEEKTEIGDGKLMDGKVVFQCEHGVGELIDGEVIVTTHDGVELGSMKKVHRKSKTLGAEPPEGAVVLFNGSNVDGWKNGKMAEDKTLMQGTTSKKVFGSHKIHIEFRLPYMPKDRGQGRGNSGIYVQGRYEIQMLDSFGLEGKKNQCGGIYSVKDCDLNMCYPPLSWQTYDIEYTAAKYDGEKMISKPRMTVYHNGVKIHDDVELPGDRNTTAAPLKAGAAKGPIFLQNHGCPVRYRNIWVVERE